ncbi:putative glycerol-3-phosphate dehydrogenase NAD(+) 1, cytosolic [Porphyridium purpureum]|uniref:Putative glycerol-3-phosphate dehydrogenase NAD(+) 1, cytosolic n=1 Tax=Porphyridium purpureum TaxID=35688 RepID=A0A5J4YHZ2_PORPP|nr:putative glycerol-3-phosphate dehydrogenase NAD(+) 1, cytosolic [Porphyridium purpureum]|eukprot:POR6944..scf297_16
MVVDRETPAASGLLSEEEGMERLRDIRAFFDIPEDRPLNVVGIGAGAWGAVFMAMLEKQYGSLDPQRKLINVVIWRREGKTITTEVAAQLLETINSYPDVIRRLRKRGSYIKYVEARMGDRQLTADEILRDGFCANMIHLPLCPLNVVTDLEEAVWNADIVINSLPSTDARGVFERIGTSWKERDPNPEHWPVVISLAKGVECLTDPFPHILTPTSVLHSVTGLPQEKLMYLGGPNIAAEVWDGRYATSRLCGAEKYRKSLAVFLRSPNFVVWDHADVITHEVMGGLKNVYAIGAGIIAAATDRCATSMSVYFSNACSEMVFITHLLSPEPDYLAGPLLADTYVTLLKGRNSWYGEQLGRGLLFVEDGDSVPGKGTIQGVSATAGFYELLSHPSVEVKHPLTGEVVSPIDILPTLSALYKFLSGHDTVDLTPRSPAPFKKNRTGKVPPGLELDREGRVKRALEAVDDFVMAMKDASASDPSESLALSKLSHGEIYNPKLCFAD